jgi:hypothetical protein
MPETGHDVLVIVVRLGFFLGAMNLLSEGKIEIPILRNYFLAPDLVPGRSRIVEHFLMQHILFPAIGFGIALAPVTTFDLLKADALRLTLFLLMLMVLIPEFIVSFSPKSGDMFRPFPFEVKGLVRERIHMITIGSFRLNFLMFLHVLLAHLIFVVTFFYFLVWPVQTQRWFVGA